LVVRIGGEGLGLLGRDGCVPLDERSHNTSSSLNTQGEWSNIKKKQVTDFLRGISSQDGSLDSSAIGNSLIRVDGFAKFLAVEEVLITRIR
jgi:hypothetical protein